MPDIIGDETLNLEVIKQAVREVLEETMSTKDKDEFIRQAAMQLYAMGIYSNKDNVAIFAKQCVVNAQILAENLKL